MSKPSTPRRAAPVYERIIPFVLTILAILVLAGAGMAMAVLLGLWPG